MRTAFSPDLEEEIKKEISQLFDRLDTDKNRALSADELVQMFRPMAPKYGMPADLARDAIAAMDQDGDGRISKQEFIEFVLPEQKKQLLLIEDQMEDLRLLFKEQVARAGNAQQGLTINKPQLKELIVTSGYKDVTDKEVDSLFKEIDIDKSNTIDIDEFMAFIYTGDRLNINSTSKDTVMKVRKNHTKINSLDVFDMFRRMPNSFQTASTKQLVEVQRQSTPSAGLLPAYDFKNMRFGNIGEMKGYLALKDDKKKYLKDEEARKNFTAIGISLSEIVGVPNLQALKDLDPHVELRVYLFDNYRKVLRSSVHTISCLVDKPKDYK